MSGILQTTKVLITLTFNYEYVLHDKERSGKHIKYSGRGSSTGKQWEVHNSPISDILMIPKYFYKLNSQRELLSASNLKFDFHQ